MAAANNSKEMCELLISKGADINAKNIIYWKIILLFKIKVIYNNQRKFNQQNGTPLHYAAEKNSKEIGELLISKGADINAKTIILSQYKAIVFLKVI